MKRTTKSFARMMRTWVREFEGAWINIHIYHILNSNIAISLRNCEEELLETLDEGRRKPFVHNGKHDSLI